MPKVQDQEKQIAYGIIRAIAIVIGVSLLLFVLYKLSAVIIYLIIAAVVSLITRPFVGFLKNRLKFGNTLAVFFSMGLLIFIFLGIFSLFIPLIVKETENLSLLNTTHFKENMEYIINQSDTFLQEKNINILDELKKMDYAAFLKKIPNLFNSIIGAFGNILVGFFSVLFISFFFMMDASLLNKNILALVPNEKEEKFVKSFSKIKDLLSRYFIGLIIQIGILFILYTILLMIVGIENAMIIAFLAALLNLIPYVGPMIGVILMLILTMTDNLMLDFQTQILPKTLYVFVGYIIVQFIDNFFNQPFIFSKSTKSHPLEIFLIILVAGILFGIIGMVLAVPSYTALKVILKEFLSENTYVKYLTKSI